MESLSFLFCRNAADQVEEIVVEALSPKKRGKARNDLLSALTSCQGCCSESGDAYADEVESADKAGRIKCFASAALTSAETAIDSSLEDVNELRRMLKPYGYTIKEIDVSLGLIPSIKLQILIAENASLDDMEEDDLSELQAMVVSALRKKSLIEPALARHKMVFTTLKIDIGLKPKVCLVLQWRPEADLDDEPDDDDPVEELEEAHVELKAPEFFGNCRR